MKNSLLRVIALLLVLSMSCCFWACDSDKTEHLSGDDSNATLLVPDTTEAATEAP